MKTYKTGKVAEVEIALGKAIQIPVSVSEEVGIRNDEKGNEIPIINTIRFNVAILLANLPKSGKKVHIKEEIKKAYLQYLADQHKYKDLDNLEFTE